MSSSNRNRFAALLTGDIIVLAISLWLTLALRYFELPSRALLDAHVPAFALLIATWCLVFLIAGLYERRASVLRDQLFGTILNAQIANCGIATAFFYFVPFFEIAPKTNLFLYLIVSSALLVLWRLHGARFVLAPAKTKAFIIGDGPDVNQLAEEVASNPSHGIALVGRLSLAYEDRTAEAIVPEASLIIADLSADSIRPLLPALYDRLFEGARFVSVQEAYESIFGRVPLSLVDHDWFIENVTAAPKIGYDAIKRALDIAVALIVGIPSLLFYPFAILAIKLEDGGKPFIVQERIGKGNRIVKIYKFRSMSVDDNGKWLSKNDNRHTVVGKMLRKSRIDELPQLWNVLKGDISLIGPRPDIVGLWSTLESEIPYYAMRAVVKPGLSGWAQINQDLPPQTIEETKVRLSYDLYYVRHRSFALDLSIALRTIKTLLSRTGL